TRVETPRSRRSGCYPKRCVTDGKLSNDVLSLTHEVERRRAERRLVERHRLTRPVDPQLGLNPCHTSPHSADHSFALCYRADPPQVSFRNTYPRELWAPDDCRITGRCEGRSSRSQSCLPCCCSYCRRLRARGR